MQQGDDFRILPRPPRAMRERQDGEAGLYATEPRGQTIRAVAFALAVLSAILVLGGMALEFYR